MKLKRLCIQRMPGFEQRGLEPLTQIAEGLNVIYGANGSGKSSCCRAVRALLWPTTIQLTPLALSSVWDVAGKEVECTREGELVTMELPVPPAHLAHCFTIGIDDLFDSDDQDLAERMALSAQGGYDLSALKKSLPKFHGRTEWKALRISRAERAKVQNAHRELLKRREKLSGLTSQIDKLRVLAQRTPAIDRALRYQELEQQLQVIEDELSYFPEAMSNVQDGDVQRGREIAHELAANQPPLEISALSRDAREALASKAHRADTLRSALDEIDARLPSLSTKEPFFTSWKFEWIVTGVLLGATLFHWGAALTLAPQCYRLYAKWRAGSDAPLIADLRARRSKIEEQLQSLNVEMPLTLPLLIEKARRDEEKLERYEETLARLKSEERALFTRIGVRAQHELESLGGSLAAYRKACTKQLELLAQLGSLEVDVTLSALSRENLEALRLEAQEAGAKRDALLEERKEIEVEIDRAMRESDLEEASRNVQLAENDMQARFEERLKEIARDTLVELLEESRQETCALMARASEWLGRFTHGRYALRMEAERFAAYDANEERTLPIEALSRGTRTQLLLASRLAFIDDYPDMPIFLDEALAHTDYARREAIANALITVAESGRQIFYLTCQQDEVLSLEALAQKRAVTFSLHKLSHEKLRGSSYEVEEVPKPEGKALSDYLQHFAIDPISTSVSASSTPIAHLVDSSDAYYRLRLLRLLSWGQFKQMKSKTIDGEESARIRDRGKLLESYFQLVSIGRGKRVSREMLKSSGACGTFLEPLSEISKEVESDAKALIEIVEQKKDARLKGYRKASAERLCDYLIEAGALDPRARLSEEEIRMRLIEEQTPSLDFETKAHFMSKVLSL